MSSLIAAHLQYETVDYSLDAGPPLHALAVLDASAFFHREPQMGLFTLLVRWPFVAIARIWGGGTLDEYRLGLVPCLTIVICVSAFLGRAMARRGRSTLAIGVTVGLWLFNPVALQSINIGHPEELVGGSLLVLAVLVAGTSPALAGGVLGCALATKQWALAAALPVIMASRRAASTAAIAAAVFVPLELVLILGNFHAYTRVGHFGVVIGHPAGAWWPLESLLGEHAIVLLARPMVLVSSFTISAAAWLKGGIRRVDEQLALLALVLLLRVLLDPTGNDYFGAPLLMALLAFEGMRYSGKRLPLISLGVAVLDAFTFNRVRGVHLGGAAPDAIFLVWALPLAVHLWRSTGAGAGYRPLRNFRYTSWVGPFVSRSKVSVDEKTA